METNPCGRLLQSYMGYQIHCLRKFGHKGDCAMTKEQKEQSQAMWGHFTRNLMERMGKN